MNAIDRCFARVDHAKRHAERLSQLVAGIELDPNVLEFVGELEVGQRIAGVVRSDIELPIEVSLVFGDVMHNLRSALDNLAWALAETACPSPHRFTSFPIVTDQSKWNKEVRSQLPDLSTEAVAFIRSHQPFMCRNPFNEPDGIAPEDNVLARLAVYSNNDKHRVPVVLAGYAIDADVQSITANGCLLTQLPTESGPVLMQTRAVVVEYLVESTGPDATLDVGGSISWIAALENGEHVMQFVDLAHAYVHDLIIEAAPHL